MTGNTTIDNDVIARFMDLEPDYMDSYLIVYKKGGFNNEIWRQNELKYDRSWDWLMEVVLKIENIRLEVPNFNVVDWFEVQRFGNTCLIQSGLRGTEDYMKSPYFYELSSSAETEILATYNAVYKFIEWYNKLDKNE